MNCWFINRLFLLTSPLCWPISGRADTGDISEVTLVHSGMLLAPLKPSQRQTAQQQLSCWLCSARWGLTPSPGLGAGAICLVAEQGRVQWEQKFWKRLSDPECRSAGSHTSYALLSRSFRLVFWRTCALSAQMRRKLWSPCQSVFSVFSRYSCFWARVWLSFHCCVHLVWLPQQNLPTGTSAHLSYL